MFIFLLFLIVWINPLQPTTTVYEWQLDARIVNLNLRKGWWLFDVSSECLVIFFSKKKTVESICVNCTKVLETCKEPTSRKRFVLC